MLTSLFNGVSGIKSYTNGLGSVSDNLANVSTVGYKGTRAEFSDVLYETMGGGAATGQPQISDKGYGSTMQAANIMTQGSFEVTDNPLDLAIDGGGFFVVSAPDSTAQYYTRAGQFLVDKDGYLVNQEGYRVQGWGVTGGTPAGAMGDVTVPLNSTIMSTTNQISVGVNLDAADTQSFDQSTAIDPTDAATYNYSVSAPAYDAGGDEHNLVTFYQRMSPASRTWKAQTFELVDGNYVAPAGNNQFYMHFDSDGQLLGLSTTGQAAMTSTYNSNAILGTALDTASNRIGETFSFTGQGGAETLTSSASVDFTAGAGAAANLTLGGSNFSVPAGLTAAQAATQLSDQINAAAGLGAYAVATGGAVSLYAESGAGPLDVSATGATLNFNSLTDVAALINSGQAATGTINLDAATLADGASVTVDGVQYFYDDGDPATPPPATNGFTDAASLAALIAGSGSNLTATTNGGSVYLSYNQVGQAGNQVTLAASGAGMAVSGGNLANGLDGTATHDVQATVGNNPAGGGVSLQLSRAASPYDPVTVDSANSLGGGLGYDFAGFTLDEQYPGLTGTQVAMNWNFGAGGNQNVTFEYGDPDGASTQIAQDYALFNLDQDGYPEGTLSSLDVDDEGYLVATFSNGVTQDVGALSLATFNSPANLAREGSNLWSATPASGEAKFGQPGDQTLALGSIRSGTLENSNVDMASEFVNMIIYQRAFQANTKVINTSDEMLKTAINLRT
ncbi:MAG: flagellar hook-basal body complex protein [Deltaproteobacteria bacterium]|nr:flagellar hook-basal body complex protein [Deltaproteobacteria bacterium]